jgi:hypothetical protein
MPSTHTIAIEGPSKFAIAAAIEGLFDDLDIPMTVTTVSEGDLTTLRKQLCRANRRKTMRKLRNSLVRIDLVPRL